MSCFSALRMVKVMKSFILCTAVPLVTLSTKKNCLVEIEDISLMTIEMLKHISSSSAGSTSDIDTSS